MARILIWLTIMLQDARLVYKHFATLYFVFIFDGSENELAMLDLIQGRFLDNFCFSFLHCIRGQNPKVTFFI